MNNDSRMLIYISVMTLILSCVVLSYGLFFFGWVPQKNTSQTLILPSTIVVAGLVIATINGIASNVLSGQLEKKLESLSPILRLGIPSIVFLMTLALSILIAFMST